MTTTILPLLRLFTPDNHCKTVGIIEETIVANPPKHHLIDTGGCIFCHHHHPRTHRNPLPHTFITDPTTIQRTPHVLHKAFLVLLLPKILCHQAHFTGPTGPYAAAPSGPLAVHYAAASSGPLAVHYADASSGSGPLTGTQAQSDAGPAESSNATSSHQPVPPWGWFSRINPPRFNRCLASYLLLIMVMVDG